MSETKLLPREELEQALNKLDDLEQLRKFVSGLDLATIRIESNAGDDPFILRQDAFKDRVKNLAREEANMRIGALERELEEAGVSPGQPK